jgi:hypothetical protein
MTTVTLQLPPKCDLYFQEDKILETYLSNSLVDGVEMIQDMKLKEELTKDKEFVDLHDKFSKKI